MFLLGAFLTGGAVGFAAERAVSRPHDRQVSERMMRDSLARELHLSDTQRRSVDSVYEWRRARNREIMDSVRPRFDATRDSARARLMKVLEPTQQAEFRRVIARIQSADSARRTREQRR